MFISKEYRFEASHVLPKHPGKCSRLHGHSYKVMLEIEGAIDPETNFVLDFNELDAVMKPLVDFLDHRHLNFFIEYPSAENLTILFAVQVQRLFDGRVLRTGRVRVSETEKTLAVFDFSNPDDYARLHQGGGWRIPGNQLYTEENGIMMLDFGPVRVTAAEYVTLGGEFTAAKRTSNRAVSDIRAMVVRNNPGMLPGGVVSPEAK